MAVIKDNSENEEEKIGGFEPGADDESFSIEKMDAYPGQLPDFDTYFKETVEDFQIDDLFSADEENVTTGSEAQINETETPEIELNDQPKEGSVWDAFNDNPENNNSSDIKSETENIINVNSDSDSYADIGKQAEGSQPLQSADSALSAPLVLDDELLNLLKADSSKEKKDSSKNNNTKDADSVHTEKNSFFVSAEIDKAEEDALSDKNAGANEQTLEMELGDIKAEHPSTYGFDEFEKKPEKAAESNNDIKKKKSKKEKIKKDKKQRKPINWKKYGLIAAILLIVSAAGMSVYYFNVVGMVSAWFKPHHQDEQIDTSKHPQKIKELQKTENKDVANNSESTTSKKNDNADSSKNSKIVIEDNSKNKLTSKHGSYEGKKAVVTENNIEKSTKEKIKKDIKTINKENNNHNKSVPKNIDKTNNDKNISLNQKRDVKEISEAKQKKTSKVSNSSLKHKEDKGIFVVQVYSTPSKEDAEEWLRKLKKRNLANAGISTQIVRDKIWYRVRFGNFETRDEATTTALKYGFSQSWIDRIR